MVMQYASSIGFEIKNLEFSPIKGPEGNIEYLLHLKKQPDWSGEEEEKTEQKIGELPVFCVNEKEVVEEAHKTLSGM